MANIRLTALTVGLAVGLIGAIGACSSDDAASKLQGRGGSSGASGGTSGGTSGVDGDGGPGSNPGGPPAEELLFRAVEPDFKQKCGNACHEMATYKPTPPAFLAGPDAYKSIKAQPGAIVADYYQSVLLQKGAHAGPAVGSDPTFEAKVIEWLKMESAAIQAIKKPSTDPVAIVSGPNDIDLCAGGTTKTGACVGTLTGAHLKFDASLIGGIFSMSNIKVVAPAGIDVHVYKPKLYKVLAMPNAAMQTEIVDGADTFSNTDQTVPGGAETILNPGSAFITSDGWTPFDFATDKLRIEVEKLEQGKVSVLDKPAACKNIPNFTANVLPSLRGQAGGFNLNCANCHANGLAGLSLNGADQTVVCNQVLGKLNSTDITKSLIITHLANGGGHGGGAITDTAGWTALWTNNKAVFF
ncbi:MAG: hypothetical protein JWO86_3640 [Myxococcaceae bacterium]|jgi:hypothetical protein|nr:hypothetical protein [Myxococcaceae bacterium]MEA2748837.1 hypothetical protein [Myxococcales bacterium]